MPYGPSRRGGEKVYCRCVICGYELELEEGQRCEAFRCLCCGRPLYPSIGIAKDGTVTPSRGPTRRREEEEAEALIWIPPLPPKPPLPPPTKKCRCPSCNYEIVIEWGARCLNSVCPRCGHRMAET